MIPLKICIQKVYYAFSSKNFHVCLYLYMINKVKKIKAPLKFSIFPPQLITLIRTKNIFSWLLKTINTPFYEVRLIDKSKAFCLIQLFYYFRQEFYFTFSLILTHEIALFTKTANNQKKMQKPVSKFRTEMQYKFMSVEN